MQVTNASRLQAVASDLVHGNLAEVEFVAVVATAAALVIRNSGSFLVSAIVVEAPIAHTLRPGHQTDLDRNFNSSKQQIWRI